jgi:tetratricopeptide (TPR) repeat protein
MSEHYLSQDETITEGWRALHLFTDRRDAIRLFASYINDRPARDRILFFHGDGGNGKTLLLTTLRDFYCKHVEPDDWAYLCGLSDDDNTSQIKLREGGAPVPSVFLDFGMTPRDVDRPRDEYYAPLMIRRELGRFGLHFPLFDFAQVWYLHKKRNLTQNKLKELFSSEEWGLVSTLADSISNHPYGAIAQAVFGVMGKHLGNRFVLYSRSRALDQAQIEMIQRMEPDHELVDQLPKLLALDLNAAMSQADAPSRIALFFDTHEAFWGERHDLPGALHALRDEWLRRFLAALQLSAGIVVVIAGREPPRWKEPSRVTIGDDRLDLQQVGYLSDADAAALLQSARNSPRVSPELGPALADPELQTALIDLARVGPDEVHPYYLGLCVDVVLAAWRKGEPLTPSTLVDNQGRGDTEELLIRRLLRYAEEEVAEAVRALSATRAFDLAIYRMLGHDLKFQATDPAFRTFIGFSFVWHAGSRGAGWYRIHDLLRRLFRTRGDAKTKRAHVILEAFFNSRAEAGDGTATAEAIYHANQHDPERGWSVWADAFDQALSKNQHNVCRTLLGIRNEMTFPNEFQSGKTSTLEGLYYLGLLRRDEARCNFEEALSAFDKILVENANDVSALNHRGSVLNGFGDLFVSLSQYDMAQKSYRDAIASFDTALRLAPPYIDAHNNRGNALTSLGVLQNMLFRRQEAMTNYREAIASHDATLQLDPKYVKGYVNRGVTLLALGDCNVALSRHDEATESYKEAIGAFDLALVLEPSMVTAYNNRGNALQALGKTQAAARRFDEASMSYEAAIACYATVLRLSPDFLVAHNNRGNTWTRLGEVHAGRSQVEDALISCRNAIAAFDSALDVAPEYVRAHVNRGNVLEVLGEIQASQRQFDEALMTYGDAVKSYTTALSIAPDDVGAHICLVSALIALGRLQASLSRHEQAKSTYDETTAICNRALETDSQVAAAHFGRGRVLAALGDLHVKVFRRIEAARCYRDSLNAFDTALRVAPEMDMAHFNRGHVLHQIGDFEASANHYEEAVTNFTASAAAFDSELELAHGNVEARSRRGMALNRLGDVKARLGKHEEAICCYRQALADSDSVLLLIPEAMGARNNRGIALLCMGHLEAEASQYDSAKSTYEVALGEFDIAISTAPQSGRPHYNRGNALAAIAKLRYLMNQPDDALKSYKDAIASYDTSLSIVPEDFESHGSRGLVFLGLGDLHARLSQSEEALKCYQEAVSSCEAALRLSPGFITARDNLSVALSRLKFVGKAEG